MRRLGADAGSLLWEAHDDEHMEVVHLRGLRDALRTEPLVVMRFRREASIGKRLEHPALVTPRELVDDEEFLAAVYDRPGDETLADRLRRGAIEATEAIHLLEPVLEGLSHAHDRGVVHRNLSASSIWLGDDAAKVGGFGGAKVLDMVGLTTRSTVFGVSHYRAPEQLAGGRADRRTDIWALGVLLFEMVTGRPPFAATGPLRLLEAIEDFDVDDHLDAFADTAVGESLRGALQRDRRHRFSSVDAFARALFGTHRLSTSDDGADLACWKCGHRRPPALEFCIRCGAGPLVEAPGEGRHELVVPKLRETPDDDGTRRLAGIRRLRDLVYRTYAPGLDADSRALLEERLRRAGIHVDDAARKRMTTSPFRIATGLTEDDARRLQTYLRHGEVPREDADDEAPTKEESWPWPTHVGDGIPVLRRPNDSWFPVPFSMAGVRWSSPLLNFVLGASACFFTALWLLFVVDEMTSHGIGAVGIFFFAVFSVIALPVWIALGISSWLNRAPAAGDFDAPDEGAFSPEMRARWRRLVGEMGNEDDRRLAEEFLTTVAGGLSSAAFDHLLRTRNLNLHAIFEEAEEELEALTRAPRDGEWQRLQTSWEELDSRRREEGDDSLVGERRELFEQIRRHEEAAEEAELARARLLGLIDLLRAPTDCDDVSLATASSQPTDLATNFEELRVLHQTFIDVDGYVDFSDIEPVAEDVELDIDLPERFEPIRELGSGGVARAILTYDHYREEEVVLKTPHSDLRSDPRIRTLIRREFEASRRLRHPGLVAVHELLEEDGAQILVMDYVRGVDLQSMIRWRGALPAGEVRAIAEDVLDALAAAHRSGVLHGDVKPSNIIIDDEGRGTLIDFGLARVEYLAPGDELDAMRGTPRYAAPEIREGGVVDERADLYGVGVTLLEALTGGPPGGDGSALAGDDWDAVEEGLQLRQVLERATAPSAPDRYFDAEEMAAVLHPEDGDANREELTRTCCHGCGEALPDSLGRCLHCGVRRRRVRRVDAGGRQVILRGTVDGDGGCDKRLAEDDIATVREVIDSFPGLEPQPHLEDVLARPPALFTPPVAEEDARAVSDALKERGLLTRVRGARLSAKLYRFVHSIPGLIVGSVPLLALTPVYLFAGLLAIFEGIPGRFPDDYTVEEFLLLFGFYGVLVALPTLIAWAELKPLMRPATAADSTALPEATSTAPWEDRAYEILRNAPSTHTEQIITGLAEAAADLRAAWSERSLWSDLVESVDELMDEALSEARQLVDNETAVLDSDADDLRARLERLRSRLATTDDDEDRLALQAAIETLEDDLDGIHSLRRRTARRGSALLALTRKLRRLHHTTPDDADEEWIIESAAELETVFDFEAEAVEDRHQRVRAPAPHRADAHP